MAKTNEGEKEPYNSWFVSPFIVIYEGECALETGKSKRLLIKPEVGAEIEESLRVWNKFKSGNL